MKIILLSWFFLINFFWLQGQFNPGISGGIGTGLKHRDYIAYDYLEPYYFLQLDLIKNSKESSAWQNFWHVPSIQHSLGFSSLGNSRILGKAFYYCPNIIFNLYESSFVTIQLNGSIGISYVTKTYDQEENPLNITIGSNWNNTTRAALRTQIRLRGNARIQAGLFFHHYSNTLLKSPNLGVNAFGLELNIISGKQIFRKIPVLHRDPFVSEPKRFGYILSYHEGSKTNGTVYNGPSYSIRTVEALINYNPKRYLTLLGGFGFEYDTESYHWAFASFQSMDQQSARKVASSFLIIGGFECLFGPVGLRFTPGIYLDHYEKKMFNRTAIFYYFKLPFMESILGIGASMKSHLFVADHGALTLSYQF